MRDILRLLLLVIVVAPLAIVLGGPVLVVAALRGSVTVGPIVFAPGHNKRSGRLAAFVLGLVLWIAVWGGAGVLLARDRLLPQVQAPAATVPSTVAPSPSPTHHSGASGGTSVAAASPTLPPAVSKTPQPTATPAPSRTVVAAQATAVTPTTPPPTTGVPTVAAPTETPQVSPVPTATPRSPVRTEEEAKAVLAVEQANELLRLAVANPTQENLDAIGTLWVDDALLKAQDFAAGPSQMVGQPTEVSYAHLMPPQVGDSIVPGHLTVTVTEVWTYSGPSDTFTESFEFFYTLAHQDGQWRIISYTFLGTPQTHVEVGSASRYRPTPEETQR